MMRREQHEKIAKVLDALDSEALDRIDILPALKDGDSFFKTSYARIRSIGF